MTMGLGLLPNSPLFRAFLFAHEPHVPSTIQGQEAMLISNFEKKVCCSVESTHRPCRTNRSESRVESGESNT